MKLLSGAHDWAVGGTALTIGNFDGVHLGHQALLASLRKKADAKNLPLTVLIFEPQPSEFFRGGEAPPRLSSLREKLYLFKQAAVDYVCCLRFDEKMAAMPPLEFADQYLFSRLKTRYLMIGEDFHFGYQRQGDVKLLKDLTAKHQCELVIFSDFRAGDVRVSSTKIREALKLGDTAQAELLAGRPYSMCGRVVSGSGIGRLWGIPTANINLRRLSVPFTGVFLVKVQRVNGVSLQGVANMGYRPTIDGTKLVLEIHLLDFDENIYGEMLQVRFLQKLRDEIKFSSVDILKAQIHEDIAVARKLFLN